MNMKRISLLFAVSILFFTSPSFCGKAIYGYSKARPHEPVFFERSDKFDGFPSALIRDYYLNGRDSRQFSVMLAGVGRVEVAMENIYPEGFFEQFPSPLQRLQQLYQQSGQAPIAQHPQLQALQRRQGQPFEREGTPEPNSRLSAPPNIKEQHRYFKSRLVRGFVD
ncbi:hypothetical protein ACFLX2_00605 [Candidatus Dependentiae bacterium]